MNAASAHVQRTTSAPSLPAVAAAASSSSHGRRLDHLDDIPHTGDSADCLCSSCHLKMQLFPRRQDGRIVLPHPSITRRNQRLGGPSSAEARGVREVPIQQPVQADTGEGTSKPYVQLSGPGVPAGPTQVIALYPHLLPDFPVPDDVGHTRTEIRVVAKHASRPADRSRPSRKKPYQPRTKRPEPWPRFSNTSVNQIRSPSSTIGHSDNLNVGAMGSQGYDTSAGADHQFSNPYAEINLTPSKTGGPLSWPDPYATIIEEPFPQLFKSPIGLGKRELNLSGSSTTLSHGTSLSRESEQRASPSITSPHPDPPKTKSRRSLSESQPRYDETTFLQNQTATSSDLPCDRVVPTEDPPRVIRFNSRHNPQPAMWVSRVDVKLDEDRSQERLSPPQTHTGMLRFQNPLMPESYPAIVTESTRELSVIQVKWDSERKRRQGYFAQEQGVEKSPFRHYNKTSCDFDNQ